MTLIILLLKQPKSYRPDWFVWSGHPVFSNTKGKQFWQENPTVFWWSHFQDRFRLGQANPSDVLLTEMQGERRLSLITLLNSWTWRRDGGRRPAMYLVQWDRSLKRRWSTGLWWSWNRVYRTSPLPSSSFMPKQLTVVFQRSFRHHNANFNSLGISAYAPEVFASNQCFFCIITSWSGIRPFPLLPKHTSNFS